MEKKEKTEYIVLTSKDHYNPLGIVRTLGEYGIRPIVVAVKSDPKQSVLSRYVEKKYYVSNAEEGIQLILSKYGGKREKNYILTGDDVTVMYLDKHYDELKDSFYFFNAGKAGRIREVMEKDYMCCLAAKYGFNVPKTWKVRIGEIPNDIEFPVITKAINSFGAEWKSIVHICKNVEELKEAYKRIKASDCLLLQEYIEKKDEQSYEGFSINNGRDVFFAVQNNEVFHIPGQYAPYWKNKNVDDLEFKTQAQKLLYEIGFEGIFEFEFLVGVDGKMYFLEINLRNTVNSWTATVAGMPLASLWCEAMKNKEIPNGIYKEIPDGFTTIAECFDYDARVKKGLIGRNEWIKQYRDANAKLYLGRKDFYPFFVFMFYKFIHKRVK